MNLKHLLPHFLVCFSFLQASAQPSIQRPTHALQFQINGTITGHDTGRLVLQYNDVHDTWIKDTATVTQGISNDTLIQP